LSNNFTLRKGLEKVATTRLCLLCGAWPATRRTGPKVGDRVCETCYQDVRSAEMAD
jgi:hypothetical protein